MKTQPGSSDMTDRAVSKMLAWLPNPGVDDVADAIRALIAQAGTAQDAPSAEPPKAIEVPCSYCGGSGIAGEVTHDMAVDGGDRDLEGQPIQCHVCNGGGVVLQEVEPLPAPSREEVERREVRVLVPSELPKSEGQWLDEYGNYYQLRPAPAALVQEDERALDTLMEAMSYAHFAHRISEGVDKAESEGDRYRAAIAHLRSRLAGKEKL